MTEPRTMEAAQPPSGRAIRGGRLTFEVDPDSVSTYDQDMSRLHFYESSITHAVSREPMLSVATRGPGMRLTAAQAAELYAALGNWLDLSPAASAES